MENVNPQDVISSEKLNPQGGGVLKSFPGKKSRNNFSLILTSFIVVLLGVGTGWVLANSSFGAKSVSENLPESSKGVPPQKEEEISLGEVSEKIKEVEGILVEGGIEGEGTHHLERPGGPSQNVYLTSTSLNLDSYVGKKVHVWGETLSGIKAGWLMDVVKIKEVK